MIEVVDPGRSHGEYFAKELALANANSPVYTALVTVATLTTSTNGEPVQATSTTGTVTTAATTTKDNGPQWIYNAQGKLIKKVPNGKEVAMPAASTNSTGASTFLESQPATISVSLTNTGHAFVPQTPEVFEHDADGNLIRDGRWTYQWDAENRLIGLETTATAVSNGVPRQKLVFQYDHQSRRISKQVYAWNADPWTLTSDLSFVYDGWNLLAEMSVVSGLSSVVRSYAWGLDLSGTGQGTGGIGGLLWMTSHLPLPTSHFAAFDGNGNVAALLNAGTGQVSAEYEYSPFGETIRATGPAASQNVFRFSTKYTDAETGLLYYGYRYYTPGIGKWISIDPSGEESGLNMTAFVANDSVAYGDALGLERNCLPTVVSSQAPAGMKVVQYPPSTLNIPTSGPTSSTSPNSVQLPDGVWSEKVLDVDWGCVQGACSALPDCTQLVVAMQSSCSSLKGPGVMAGVWLGCVASVLAANADTAASCGVDIANLSKIATCAKVRTGYFKCEKAGEKYVQGKYRYGNGLPFCEYDLGCNLAWRGRPFDYRCPNNYLMTYERKEVSLQ